MSKLSVVISAYNEESKLKDCLESVKWADEIVVVDNSSTDNTAKIAKQYTKYVFQQKNDPLNIDLQKNFGIDKAKGEWILVLDADERVTPELAAEIRERLATGVERLVNGYWIPRKNIIFGKWIEHSKGWYPDYQLRLFRRGMGRYKERHVHEGLAVEGDSEYLEGHLLHYNFDTIDQFFRKHVLSYAPNEAEEKLRKGYIFDYRDAIRFPFNEFLSRYFARVGYKDGFHGFMLAMLMGVYHFAIFAYLWEKKKFVDAQMNVEQELQRANKEYRYWVYSKKIDEEKNIVSKIGLKAKRKLRM